MKLKEITVFANGDSTKIKTWSNVPYFFTQSLIARGIKINRVNIGPHQRLDSIFEDTIFKLLRIFNKNSTYHFERTALHSWLTERKIKKATRQFPSTDAWLFMNFSYYNKYSNKPSILFCDWTLEYLIKNRLGRKPDLLEQLYIKKQNHVINKAAVVISMFPAIARSMKVKHSQAKICHLGTNVVNSSYKKKLNENEILEIKKNSKILLFIGDIKYIEGARLLVEAFKMMKYEDGSLSLHIVGLTMKDFDDLPEGVVCHGYLDKENESECEKYYNLLIAAKVLVNPTQHWGGYSSTIEAMYFYTPVVIAQYEDFTDTFGKSPSFAAYVESFNIDGLISKIKQVLYSGSYKESCLYAHQAVHDYTWDNYIDKFLIETGRLPD